MTSNDLVYKSELGRTEMKNLPVNLIYPANYPAKPAIMLPEFISPSDAMEALDRIAEWSSSDDQEISSSISSVSFND